MICRRCGCSWFEPCVYDDGVFAFACYWVAEDLCSFCAHSDRLMRASSIDVVNTGGLL